MNRYLVIKVILLNILISTIACMQDTINSYEKIELKFSHVSDRATAYNVNNKILSFFPNSKVITYLDKNLGVHLVLIKNYSIIEDYILDFVKTNHGGGTLVKLKDNKFCVIYGGHIEPLKVACIQISSDKFVIDKIFSLSDIDPSYNNPYPFWQTYPCSIYIGDGNLGILYREELGSIRYPRLVYMEVNVERDNPFLQKKIIIFETKDNYANFQASFLKHGENLYILWRYFGRKTINEDYFNKGVYLTILNNKSNELYTINILKNSLVKNPYISNIALYNKNIYFLYVDYNEKINENKYLNLCTINLLKKISINSMICENIKLDNLISKSENLSTTLNLFIKDNNSIFIAFNTKEEKKWTSLSNRVYYIKYNKKTKKFINLLNDYGWFPNIEKTKFKNNKIPCVLYHNLKDDFVKFVCFK